MLALPPGPAEPRVVCPPVSLVSSRAMPRICWPGLLLLLVLCLGLHAPGLVTFSVPASRTFVLRALPSAHFLEQSVRDGHFPLWTEQLLTGYPLHADPEQGLFYPPGWLIHALLRPWTDVYGPGLALSLLAEVFLHHL